MIIPPFNVILGTDGYKPGHWKMLPEGTEYLESYFEARNGAKYSYTVFAGLQPILTQYFVGQVVTRGKIEHAAEFYKKYFNGDDTMFNRDMWEHILKNHDGCLPVRIRAVPEGTVVPNSNILMTVVNTDPKCAPLTNYLETILTHVWYTSTVATLSRKVKEQIQRFLHETADSDAGLPWMLHDFGYRGVSSVESAGLGGMAHLINFNGTDTIRGIEYAEYYYGADVCGFSVPASEHSVKTALGKDGEVDIVRQLLKKFPRGILSDVGDSYDIFNYCENIIGGVLREEILARDGVFVVRPDSGDPVSTVLRCLDILGAKFGFIVNSKGFKTLNPKIRLLWGDGLNFDMIYDIMFAMKNAGWSIENIACFGMGGGLLQKVNRDTQRFAFKSCAQCRDGKWYDIFKDPVDKTKTSKKGRMALVKEDGVYKTILASELNGRKDDLVTVFEDGKIVTCYNFDQVRHNARL
jgi:nicotinamide phosphoribosyltransferase